MEFLGPLELIAIYYSLLMTVPPLLPLDQWKTLWFAKVPLANAQQHGHYYCFYCKIVEWVVLIMSTFTFFTFCWYPSSSIKVETSNSSWKHELFVVTHAEENCFAFVCFSFTTLMWFECNVIQEQVYTEISRGGGGGGGGGRGLVEGAVIFIFLLLPELVNTLILLLQLTCFL